MALKDGLDWGVRKRAKAFRGEGTARVKGRKCCRTDCWSERSGKIRNKK